MYIHMYLCVNIYIYMYACVYIIVFVCKKCAMLQYCDLSANVFKRRLLYFAI